MSWGNSPRLRVRSFQLVAAHARSHPWFPTFWPAMGSPLVHWVKRSRIHQAGEALEEYLERSTYIWISRKRVYLLYVFFSRVWNNLPTLYLIQLWCGIKQRSEGIVFLVLSRSLAGEWLVNICWFRNREFDNYKMKKGQIGRGKPRKTQNKHHSFTFTAYRTR